MSGAEKPVALVAESVTPRIGSGYPEPFASRVAERAKRVLGDAFGLTAFGVNLTRLPPGSCSALRHAHAHEDEFVYVLEGAPTLVTDAGETPLQPGMCAGFAAGSGDAHHLVNRGTTDVVYLEIGSRCDGEQVQYPDDDLAGRTVDGRWRYFHKDGQPY
ncbi:MAG TPA: cupin domain-containing protein [Lysobacter sp.]|nr:cupin domain-containing protein [Lysobacter sp.]